MFGLVGDDFLDEHNLNAIKKFVLASPSITKVVDDEGRTLLDHFTQIFNYDIAVTRCQRFREKDYKSDFVLRITYSSFLKMLIMLNEEALQMRDQTELLVSSHDRSAFVSVPVDNMYMLAGSIHRKKSESDRLQILCFRAGTGLFDEHINPAKKDSQSSAARMIDYFPGDRFH